MSCSFVNHSKCSGMNKKRWESACFKKFRRWVTFKQCEHIRFFTIWQINRISRFLCSWGSKRSIGRGLLSPYLPAGCSHSPKSKWLNANKQQLLQRPKISSEPRSASDFLKHENALAKPAIQLAGLIGVGDFYVFIFRLPRSIAPVNTCSRLSF